MSAALDRGTRKGLRTIAQLAVGGSLTALVVALVGHLDPEIQALVMGTWTALIAFLQNWLETKGTIATFLPTRTTISPVSGGVAQATVGAVIEDGGQVVGEVLDTSGDIVGKVTGQIDPDYREHD